jgi:hypothetical protein
MRCKDFSTPGALRGQRLLALLAVLGSFATISPARALVKIDFEQPYYVHDRMQVWDFSLLKDGDRFHIFYHGIPESRPSPVHADTLWHAESNDLIHWTPPAPVLNVSNAPFEASALWAPEIFRNEENGLYWLAYTTVDMNYNQRIGMAWSRDLDNWFKTRLNPVLVADPAVFRWNPSDQYQDFRDPFVYHRDGQWHMLVTARAAAAFGGGGAIAMATSDDQLNWSDQSIFFLNDGATPGNVMESVQYHVIDDFHHLFFVEYSVDGVSHIVADSPENLTFSNRALIDFGIAPEVDRFESDGAWIFSRTAPFQEYQHPALSFVARIDTLLVHPGAQHPTVWKPHPLLRHFESREGTATLGNPCFGDNPVRRGLPGAGPVGNFYFASKEYYQGPLSGRGAPGAFLGDIAQGNVKTADFTVEGRSLRALVGGGNFPATCYLGLFDAATDTIIYSETGQNVELMTWRYWDLRPYAGLQVYLKIVDAEGAVWGHINVDEIEELMDDPPAASP